MRSLRRSPRFALTAILLLAIGIGANIVVFGFADAVFFRRPDVPEAGRLVGVYGERHGRLCGTCISYPDYLIYRDRSRALEDLAVFDWGWAWHADGENSREFQTGLVTSNFFDVLRVRPLLGRFFNGEENRVPNTHAVVVLGERFWRARFEADPAILGQQLRLNRLQFTVIGVAPANIQSVRANERIDLWMPLMMRSMGQPDTSFLERREYGGFDLVGRLAPGADRQSVAAELNVVAAALAFEYRDTNAREGVAVVPLAGVHAANVRGARRGASLLGAAAICLLLIACANLAGLLTSRAAAREKEIRIRYSLGASRTAIVRQLMAESLALAVPAGALGLLCARWMREAIWGDVMYQFRQLDMEFDGRVMLFALTCSLGTAILFGLLPALLSSRGKAVDSLRVQSQTAARSIVRNVLVAGQVAFAVVMLSAAALLIASLREITAQAGPVGDRGVRDMRGGVFRLSFFGAIILTYLYVRIGGPPCLIPSLPSNSSAPTSWPKSSPWAIFAAAPSLPFRAVAVNPTAAVTNPASPATVPTTA